jgi:hypothetical protein
MVARRMKETDEEPSIIVIAIDRRVAAAAGRHVEDTVGKKVTGRAGHSDNVERATATGKEIGRNGTDPSQVGTVPFAGTVPFRDCP